MSGSAWSTIANLATALGTLILAVATFSAVGRLLTDFAASPLVLSHPVHHN